MSRKRRVALLDVNVLIALFDPTHVHHDAAHDWFQDEGRPAWATCPLTENGFVRVAVRTARSHRRASVPDVVDAFRTFTSSGGHHFWPDDLSLLNDELIDVEHVIGHQQLTDAYLLAVAVRRGGLLVTFDHRIHLQAVRGATPDHLAALAPVN